MWCVWKFKKYDLWLWDCRYLALLHWICHFCRTALVDKLLAHTGGVSKCAKNISKSEKREIWNMKSWLVPLSNEMQAVQCTQLISLNVFPSMTISHLWWYRLYCYVNTIHLLNIPLKEGHTNCNCSFKTSFVFKVPKSGKLTRHFKHSAISQSHRKSIHLSFTNTIFNNYIGLNMFCIQSSKNQDSITF